MKCRDYKALCEEVIYCVSPAGPTVGSSESIMRYPVSASEAQIELRQWLLGEEVFGYVVEEAVAATGFHEWAEDLTNRQSRRCTAWVRCHRQPGPALISDKVSTAGSAF
jgi:hypothetical protein